VTLEDSVTFISEFYEGSTRISSLMPIHLENTTAYVIWKEEVPVYVDREGRRTVGLVLRESGREG
jgi:hypothetical protein